MPGYQAFSQSLKIKHQKLTTDHYLTRSKNG